ncbi:DNRLRE domain-containing protein [Cohnella sp. CFH 77786]|uniref:stalk domain-containing protein n=1 Tax=Cohnella sp. CFH 77786 TaxID=2662265 RepID=UPI001C60F0A1|nr:glycoside hydrolase family 88 protein [Cohnella sp. CFH 77786]MBW5447123.1 DNRLRE domain-containing protein [Cohnella sp. CFH 77786]
MKPSINLLLAIAMLLSLVHPMASVKARDPTRIVLDGIPLASEVEPQILKNRVFVPLRLVSEAIKQEVIWNARAKTVEIKGEHHILLPLQSTAILVDGKHASIEAGAYLHGQSVMVPVRFMAEMFGLDVKWRNNTVYLSSPPLPKVKLNAILNRSKTLLLNGDRSASIRQSKPDAPGNDLYNLKLESKEGDRKKGLLHFDLAALEGKQVYKAYLRLVNSTSAEINAYRTLYVYEAGKPWTPDATWDTFDGARRWERPGASGDRDARFLASQTVFRINSWEPVWFLDVTDTVRAWLRKSTVNNGFMLASDMAMSLFNPPRSGTQPSLVVVMQPDLSIEEKWAAALDALGSRFTLGPWSDPHSGIINAQMNAAKLGLGNEFIEAIENHFDYYIAHDGTLIRFAAKLDSYYKAVFGSSLIYLYDKTGNEKFMKAAVKLRGMFDSLRQRDGIFTDGPYGAIQSELSYLGLAFLAVYGDRFHDEASTRLAMDQILKLYDLLMKDQTDGIPYTLIDEYTKTGKGWARGIGYLFGGMGKLVDSKGIRGDERYGELAARYVRLAASLKQYQTERGLWRNLIHDPNSPLESSGTSLIATGFQYGIAAGLLPPSDQFVVDRALRGVTDLSMTGADLGEAYPGNQDLVYTYEDLSMTQHAFGFWMELLTARERLAN